MLDRRQFLTASLGASAALGLAACAPGRSEGTEPAMSTTPRAPASARGAARQLSLRAQATTVDLGGTIAETWAYGPVPGEPLRATAGDLVRVDFVNDLPVATSVHWHGLAIRNDMDGVPNVTTPETPAGGSFPFEFVVPDAGTHWFHPHHGLQMSPVQEASHLLGEIQPAMYFQAAAQVHGLCQGLPLPGQ